MATSVIRSDYYQTGETYTIRGYLSGYITGGSVNVSFNIFLPKMARGISSVTITTAELRTVSGRINLDVTKISDIAYRISENSVGITLTMSEALSVTTNTPFSGNIYGTITFS